MPYQVGVIGIGNMGASLLTAFLKSGISSKSIAISDNFPAKIHELEAKFYCKGLDNLEVSNKASNLFIAVKPQDLDELLENIGGNIRVHQRVISIVAGKKTSRIEKFLSEGVPVLRVMPNTPMSVGVGALSLIHI